MTTITSKVIVLAGVDVQNAVSAFLFCLPIIELVGLWLELLEGRVYKDVVARLQNENICWIARTLSSSRSKISNFFNGNFPTQKNSPSLLQYPPLCIALPSPLPPWLPLLRAMDI